MRLPQLLERRRGRGPCRPPAGPAGRPRTEPSPTISSRQVSGVSRAFDEGLALERVRLGVAAADVDEVARLGQERPDGGGPGLASRPGESACRAAWAPSSRRPSRSTGPSPRSGQGIARRSTVVLIVVPPSRRPTRLSPAAHPGMITPLMILARGVLQPACLRITPRGRSPLDPHGATGRPVSRGVDPICLPP